MSVSRLLAAFQTPTVAADAADIHNTQLTPGEGSTALIATAAGRRAPQYIPESCVVAAEQSFSVLGGAFVQGFGLLFERLNPELESFVNSLLDAQATGPPNSRQAQRRLVASTVAAMGDSENARERDYSHLPPAPPPRAPLSARTPPTHTPRDGARSSPRTAPPIPSRSRQGTPRIPIPTSRAQPLELSPDISAESPPLREIVEMIPPPPPVTRSETPQPATDSPALDSESAELSIETESPPHIEQSVPTVTISAESTDILTVGARSQSPTSLSDHEDHSTIPIEQCGEETSIAAHLLFLALNADDEERPGTRPADTPTLVDRSDLDAGVAVVGEQEPHAADATTPLELTEVSLVEESAPPRTDGPVEVACSEEVAISSPSAVHSAESPTASED